MFKKSDLRKIVSKTFDDTKAARVKKICLRAAHSFSGLSERNILGITNHETKYRKFNAKLMNKAAPGPVRAENVFSMSSLDLVDMKIKFTNTSCRLWTFLVDFIG